MQNELLTTREQVESLLGKVVRLEYGTIVNAVIIERIHPHLPWSNKVKIDMRKADGSLSSGMNIVGGFSPVYATTWEG